MDTLTASTALRLLCFSSALALTSPVIAQTVTLPNQTLLSVSEPALNDLGEPISVAKSGQIQTADGKYPVGKADLLFTLNASSELSVLVEGQTVTPGQTISIPDWDFSAYNNGYELEIYPAEPGLQGSISYDISAPKVWVSTDPNAKPLKLIGSITLNKATRLFNDGKIVLDGKDLDVKLFSSKAEWQPYTVNGSIQPNRYSWSFTHNKTKISKMTSEDNDGHITTDIPMQYGLLGESGRSIFAYYNPSDCGSFWCGKYVALRKDFFDQVKQVKHNGKTVHFNYVAANGFDSAQMMIISGSSKEGMYSFYGENPLISEDSLPKETYKKILLNFRACGEDKYISDCSNYIGTATLPVNNASETYSDLSLAFNQTNNSTKIGKAYLTSNSVCEIKGLKQDASYFDKYKETPKDQLTDTQISSLIQFGRSPSIKKLTHPTTHDAVWYTELKSGDQTHYIPFLRLLSGNIEMIHPYWIAKGSCSASNQKLFIDFGYPYDGTNRIAIGNNIQSIDDLVALKYPDRFLRYTAPDGTIYEGESLSTLPVLNRANNFLKTRDLKTEYPSSQLAIFDPSKDQGGVVTTIMHIYNKITLVSKTDNSEIPISTLAIKGYCTNGEVDHFYNSQFEHESSLRSVGNRFGTTHDFSLECRDEFVEN